MSLCWLLEEILSDAELPYSYFLFIALQFYIFQVGGFPLKKTTFVQTVHPLAVVFPFFSCVILLWSFPYNFLTADGQTLERGRGQ